MQQLRFAFSFGEEDAAMSAMSVGILGRPSSWLHTSVPFQPEEPKLSHPHQPQLGSRLQLGA